MNDLREALEDAYEAEPDEVEGGESSVEAAANDIRDDVHAAVGEESETAESEVPEGDGQVADSAETDEPGQDNDGPSAPLGWNAEAREGWGNVPDAAKATILKREQEVEAALRNSATARRAYQHMTQLNNTYGAVMAAEGHQNAPQAFEAMMQTVSQLRMGSPAQKAQKLADLVHHFGVDVSALDSALVGKAPEVDQNTQSSWELQQMIDQRMAPVNHMMQTVAQQQQMANQQASQQVASEVDQFGAQAEFMNDVRGDMADLLDMASRRGQQMTLQEAYDKACAVNPQVQSVMQQRIAKKNAAASSVAGQAQASTSARPESLEDTLRDAWASHS